MRSNFVRVSTSALIALLLFVLVVGGVGGQNRSVASAQTMAGTMAGDMAACPAGAVAAAPGMFEQMAAQMMGTMPAGAATMAAAPATMAAAPATMAATMAGTMAAGGMAEVAFSADMTGAGCIFAVALSGVAEKPNPGDPEGTGTTLVLVDSATNTICYDFSRVTGITLPAAAAHIHNAGPDAAGPVVVPFQNKPDAQGMGRGCVTNVPADIVSGILSTPGSYYVNVHTSDFPAGAIRGQLTGATAQ
jgi:hypothetical protein